MMKLQFEVLKGGRKPDNCRDLHSELDFDGLIAFQDTMRVLIVWVTRLHARRISTYADILRDMDCEIGRTLGPLGVTVRGQTRAMTGVRGPCSSKTSAVFRQPRKMMTFYGILCG